MQDLFRVSACDAANGVIAFTCKERIQFYNAWTQWLSIYLPKLSHTLKECPLALRLNILVAYGRHVRLRGVSNRKHKVCVQTVALAFKYICSTMQFFCLKSLAISKYVVGHRNIGGSVWFNPISNKELLTRGTWIMNGNA